MSNWEERLDEKLARGKKVNDFIDLVRENYPAFVAETRSVEQECWEMMQEVTKAAEHRHIYITINDQQSVENYFNRHYGVRGVNRALASIQRGCDWLPEHVVQDNFPEGCYFSRSEVKKTTIEVQFPASGFCSPSYLPDPIKVRKNGKHVYAMNERVLELVEMEKQLYKRYIDALFVPVRGIVE